MWVITQQQSLSYPIHYNFAQQKIRKWELSYYFPAMLYIFSLLFIFNQYTG